MRIFASVSLGGGKQQPAFMLSQEVAMYRSEAVLGHSGEEAKAWYRHHVHGDPAPGAPSPVPTPSAAPTSAQAPATTVAAPAPAAGAPEAGAAAEGSASSGPAQTASRAPTVLRRRKILQRDASPLASLEPAAPPAREPTPEQAPSQVDAAAVSTQEQAPFATAEQTPTSAQAQPAPPEPEPEPEQEAAPAAAARRAGTSLRRRVVASSANVSQAAGASASQLGSSAANSVGESRAERFRRMAQAMDRGESPLPEDTQVLAGGHSQQQDTLHIPGKTAAPTPEEVMREKKKQAAEFVKKMAQKEKLVQVQEKDLEGPVTTTGKTLKQTTLGSRTSALSGGRSAASRRASTEADEADPDELDPWEQRLKAFRALDEDDIDPRPVGTGMIIERCNLLRRDRPPSTPLSSSTSGNASGSGSTPNFKRFHKKSGIGGSQVAQQRRRQYVTFTIAEKNDYGLSTLGKNADADHQSFDMDDDVASRLLDKPATQQQRRRPGAAALQESDSEEEDVTVLPPPANSRITAAAAATAGAKRRRNNALSDDDDSDDDAFTRTAAAASKKQRTGAAGKAGASRSAAAANSSSTVGPGRGAGLSKESSNPNSASQLSSSAASAAVGRSKAASAAAPPPTARDRRRAAAAAASAQQDDSDEDAFAFSTARSSGRRR